MGCIYIFNGEQLHISKDEAKNLSMSICGCKSESKTRDWALFLLIKEALVIILNQLLSVDNIWNGSVRIIWSSLMME